MKQILLTIFLFFIVACQNSSTENSNLKEGKETVTNEILLQKEASRLRGGGSIKKIELIGKKVKIEYVKNFDEYQKINPHSKLTKKDLDVYWSTGKAIKKAMNDGSVRLMRKLDFVEETEITLPYKGKTYTINVSKNKLEDFLGRNFEEVKKDWAKNFSDEFVYSELGREKFFSTFGQVK